MIHFIRKHFLKTIFLIILILIIVAINRKSIQLDDQIYTFFSKLNLVKEKTYISEDLDEYIAQEGFDFEKENKKIIADSMYKLYDKNISSATEFKIPTISHHVYLSANKKSKKINPLYVEMLKISLSKLNNSKDNWQHIIWTNMPELFSKEIHNIKGVIFKDISIFKEHRLYQTLTSLIVQGKNLVGHLAEASDMLRLMALQKHGGVYLDMDYEIYHENPLFDLMKKFDFIGVKGVNRYYENGFIASKPNHPIINKAIDLEIRNNKLDSNIIPDAIKYPRDKYRKIYFSGPPLLTVAYLDKNNIEGNSDILLPYFISFNSKLAQYKNKNCGTKFSKEEFENGNRNLETILSEFITQSPAYRSEKILDNYQQNIYYDFINNRNDFKIIGADMSCGSWNRDPKGFYRIYYWKWPFKN